MSHRRSKLQVVLYRTFFVTGTIAVLLGLHLIWSFAPEPATTRFLMRVLGTCVVLAVASAFALSATRLVDGRPPEDDA